MQEYFETRDEADARVAELVGYGFSAHPLADAPHCTVCTRHPNDVNPFYIWGPRSTPTAPTAQRGMEMETTQMTVNLNGATYGICANPTDDGFFLLTVAELNDDGAPFRWLCDEGDGQIYESARGATIAGVHYVA